MTSLTSDFHSILRRREYQSIPASELTKDREEELRKQGWSVLYTQTDSVSLETVYTYSRLSRL